MTKPKAHSTGPGEAPLDMDKLWEMAMYDEGLLKELIRLFLDDAPGRISSLRRAIANNEPQTVGVISHGLRGASQSMTADKLGELFNTLEALGETGSMDGAEELIGEVEMEFDRLRDFLSTADLHAPRAVKAQEC
jgi:HPt (histidine-containing phosphotransfer) domain-containing protein